MLDDSSAYTSVVYDCDALHGCFRELYCSDPPKALTQVYLGTSHVTAPILTSYVATRVHLTALATPEP